MAEVSIPPGTIVDGKITDMKQAAVALEALKHKLPLRVRYAIVSISAENTYTKLFHFPGSLRGQRLTDSIDLAVNFQLPFPSTDKYVDSEIVSQDTQTKALITAAPRSIVDQYIKLLLEAGISPIAIETFPLSLARTLEVTNTLLVEVETTDTTQIYVIDNNRVLFSRDLPKKHLSYDQIQKEIVKTVEFISSEYGKTPEVRKITSLQPALGLVDLAGQKTPTGLWLVTLGAALRGTFRRVDDHMLSLMPVHTAQAYTLQRAITVSRQLNNFITAIALFFLCAFVGVWVFMINFQEQVTKGAQITAASPSTSQAVQLREEASHINSLVQTAAGIVRSEPQWSQVLSEIQTRTTAGITITSIHISDPILPIQITGVATGRDQLNNFKNSLDDSAMFGNIILPLRNLEKKIDIPFDISFNLKNPVDIYPK
jgi:Tfp pilus assembly PilM family ATPase